MIFSYYLCLVKAATTTSGTGVRCQHLIVVLEPAVFLTERSILQLLTNTVHPIIRFHSSIIVVEQGL